MKKNKKLIGSIISFALMLVIVPCAAIFAACGGTEKEETIFGTYTGSAILIHDFVSHLGDEKIGFDHPIFSNEDINSDYLQMRDDAQALKFVLNEDGTFELDFDIMSIGTVEHIAGTWVVSEENKDILVLTETEDRFPSNTMYMYLDESLVSTTTEDYYFYIDSDKDLAFRFSEMTAFASK